MYLSKLEIVNGPIKCRAPLLVNIAPHRCIAVQKGCKECKNGEVEEKEEQDCQLLYWLKVHKHFSTSFSSKCFPAPEGLYIIFYSVSTYKYKINLWHAGQSAKTLPHPTSQTVSVLWSTNVSMMEEFLFRDRLISNSIGCELKTFH